MHDYSINNLRFLSLPGFIQNLGRHYPHFVWQSWPEIYIYFNMLAVLSRMVLREAELTRIWESCRAK